MQLLMSSAMLGALRALLWTDHFGVVMVNSRRWYLAQLSDLALCPEGEQSCEACLLIEGVGKAEVLTGSLLIQFALHLCLMAAAEQYFSTEVGISFFLCDGECFLIYLSYH